VESGEGIERPHITALSSTSKVRWNPVKELKDKYSAGRRQALLPVPWNPVKELKGIDGSTMEGYTTIVESGEGIERPPQSPGYLEPPLPPVESGEGIESEQHSGGSW